MKKIVVGSRRSELALTQAKQFLKTFTDAYPDVEIEIKEIVTKGDKILDVQLSKVGGKGLFIKEIEQALLEGEIDIAIHSMKDVPSELHEDLTIACVPTREDMRDAFVSKDKVSFRNLPAGSVVGTSSLRRKAQLLGLRDDIEVKWIRGNINTRLQKMKDGEYDAIVLAAAGIKRMGWDDIVTEYFSVDDFVPAIAQGALGVEVRKDNHELFDMLQAIENKSDRTCVNAERTFLNRMDGSCHVPIGGYASYEDEELYLTGLIMDTEGTVKYVVKKSHDNPTELGNIVADEMEKIGAKQLLDEVTDEA